MNTKYFWDRIDAAVVLCNKNGHEKLGDKLCNAEPDEVEGVLSDYFPHIHQRGQEKNFELYLRLKKILFPETKFRVSFKSPDALSDLSKEQREFAELFVKYGEYITIEFDLAEGTAKVV